MKESTATTEAAPTVSESTRQVVTTVTMHATLRGAELRKVPHSSSGRQYRPDDARIVYVRRDGGTWSVDAVNLSGANVLKGGKPGSMPVVEKWYGRPSKLPWLAELVDQYVPFDV